MQKLRVEGDKSVNTSVIIRSPKLTTPTYTLSCDVQINTFSNVLLMYNHLVVNTLLKCHLMWNLLEQNKDVIQHLSFLKLTLRRVGPSIKTDDCIKEKKFWKIPGIRQSVTHRYKVLCLVTFIKYKTSIKLVSSTPFNQLI